MATISGLTLNPSTKPRCADIEKLPKSRAPENVQLNVLGSSSRGSILPGHSPDPCRQYAGTMQVTYRHKKGARPKPSPLSVQTSFYIGALGLVSSPASSQGLPQLFNSLGSTTKPEVSRRALPLARSPTTYGPKPFPVSVKRASDRSPSITSYPLKNCGSASPLGVEKTTATLTPRSNSEAQWIALSSEREKVNP